MKFQWREGIEWKSEKKNIETTDGFWCEIVVLILSSVLIIWAEQQIFFVQKKKYVCFGVQFRFVVFCSTKLCAISTFCDQSKLTFQMKCFAAVSSH